MIVTNAGWVAVDAAAFCARWDRRAGRKTCERSTARGREMLQRTAKSCGPDAPTLASSSRSCVGPTGLKTKLNPRTTVAKQPGHRGEHDISVKTIACGNAGRFRCTRCYSCAFYHYKVHTRLRVQRAPGIPHALKGAEDKCKPRAHRAARSRICVWNQGTVIASEAKQSMAATKG